MQQASSTSGKVVVSATGNILPPAAAAARFVINLCASTTPVGLVQPSHAGLKRFTFFVSRRLEEGRERFRLHMGYFDSQEEAEKILDLVRDVYPAAWAGVAPGIKLRARAAASEAAASGAPAPDAAAAKAPAPGPAAAVVAPAVAPAITAPPEPPVVHAAPVAAAAPAPIAPAPAVKLELVPDLPRAIPAPIPELETPNDGAARSLRQVRATIDSLGDAPPAQPAQPAPSAQPAQPAAAAGEAALEGAAVLRLLESARPGSAARIAPQPAPRAAAWPPQPAVSAPPRAEPALFAVQLLWSVQPIDMGKVPQLAIFSAYTLYGAEGNRDGRRWYGLRLGFFTDAVSAKQVAHYVRSEFTSVSVVPVSVRERARAGAATAKALPAISSARRSGPELNFIEDVPTDTATSGSRPALQLPDDTLGGKPEITPAVRAAMDAVGVSSSASPGGKRAKLRVAQGTRPVSKRPTHNRPLSLEETLEILGAGELQVDNGRGELINDGSRRERKSPATPSGSRFGRLINRLAERLGNS
jgi:hypothetical protein